MTTRPAAEKAVLVYKETQPAIDALRTVIARNRAAKLTLGNYMEEKQVGSFRGVAMRLVASLRLDNDKVLLHLGDKVRDFQKPVNSRHFELVKRRAPK